MSYSLLTALFCVSVASAAVGYILGYRRGENAATMAALNTILGRAADAMKRPAVDAAHMDDKR